MLKLVMATLALGSILFVALINRSPVNDVLQSAEFPETNTSNRISVAELSAIPPRRNTLSRPQPPPLRHRRRHRPHTRIPRRNHRTRRPRRIQDGTQFSLRQKHVNRMFTDKAAHSSDLNAPTISKQF